MLYAILSMSMDIFNRKLKAEVLPGVDRSIVIGRAIRSSGLLACISPEDFQTLIALLTFADESGRCSLSARIIGQSLNLSENQARKRLNRLCRIRWRGKPLVVKESGREDGKFIPAVYQVMEVEGVKLVSSGRPGVSKLKSDLGDRKRSRDGSSGEAVPLREGEVVRLKLPSDSETPAVMVKGSAVNNSCVSVNNNINKHTTTLEKDSVLDVKESIRISLVNTGVSEHIASELVRNYPAERITRQLRMLPFRNAREPAAMLVKAIREDWSAPSAYTAMMREKAAMQAKKKAESQDELRRETQRQRIEEAISRLTPAELQDITIRAREAVRATLKGALRGYVPQSLVDAQVKKIISDEYLSSFGKA